MERGWASWDGEGRRSPAHLCPEPQPGAATYGLHSSWTKSVYLAAIPRYLDWPVCPAESFKIRHQANQCFPRSSSNVSLIARFSRTWGMFFVSYGSNTWARVPGMASFLTFLLKAINLHGTFSPHSLGNCDVICHKFSQSVRWFLKLENHFYARKQM